MAPNTVEVRDLRIELVGLDLDQPDQRQDVGDRPGARKKGVRGRALELAVLVVGDQHVFRGIRRAFMTHVDDQ